MDTKAVDGAIVLAQHDPTIGRALYDGFTGARVVQAEAMTAAQARDLADDYVRLANALGIVKRPSQLVVRDPNSYVEIAAALASKDVEGTTWTHFVPQDAGAVGNIVASREASRGWSDAVRVAATAGVSNWDLVIDKARAGLSGEARVPSAEQLELLGAVHALAFVTASDAATKLLDELTDPIAFAVDPGGPAERALLSALAAVGLPGEDGATITTPADPEALGVWLYTLLARQGTLSGVGHARRDLERPADRARAWLADALQSANDDVCRAIARAVIAVGDARKLFKAAREAGSFRHWPADRMLMMRVLEMMADAGAPPRVLPPELLIDEWDAAFPGWSRYPLARSMRSRRREIAETLANAPFDDRLAGAYAGTLDAHTVGDDALVSLAVSQLPTVTPDRWTTALANGDMGLSLLHAALARRGQPLTLSREVRDAVRTFVVNPPQNQRSDPAAAAAIMAIFDETEREEIVEQVLDALAAEPLPRQDVPAGSVKWSSAARLLAGFAGLALLDPARLRDRPHRFAVAAAYVLQNGTDRELAALQQVARAEPALIQTLGADQRTTLIGIAKGQLATHTSEQRRAALFTLSEMLGPETPLDTSDAIAT
jgi:hypothetical protein